MQFPFITYGMALCINDSIPTKHSNIVKIYVYASELRNVWHFYIVTVLFLSIFCWYFRYFVGTNDMLVGFTCTNKFPNAPTKLRKSVIGGNCPPAPPPPPSGYAIVTFMIRVLQIMNMYTLPCHKYCNMRNNECIFIVVRLFM